MSINAKILRIDSKTEHNGVAFTQWAMLKIASTDDCIYVFDKNCLIKSDMIGESYRMEISPTYNVSDISRIGEQYGAENRSYGITPIDDSSPIDYMISGEIVECISQTQTNTINKTPSGTSIVLDVGIGTIQFEIGDDLNTKVENGDILKLPALRLDIEEIQDN